MPPIMPFGPYKHITDHPAYGTWCGIIQRCTNPNSSNFRLYGGRGIRVHDDWRDSAAFLTWIDANLGPRLNGMSIDRIDVNGNYEPGNVQWATKSEQNLNQRPPTCHACGRLLREPDLADEAPGA